MPVPEVQGPADGWKESALTQGRVIMCVFAHPDDESFMAAGVACKHGEEGARVALVAATLGEEGSSDQSP